MGIVTSDAPGGATVSAVRALGAATVLFVLVACSESGDASKELACRDYAELAADGLAGVLSDDEFTERSRAIYETAQPAADSEFVGLAAELAGATQVGDYDAAVDTLIAISEECGA